jgi:hypothetical protein
MKSNEKLEGEIKNLAARKPHDYNINDQLFGWSGAGTAL